MAVRDGFRERGAPGHLSFVGAPSICDLFGRLSEKRESMHLLCVSMHLLFLMYTCSCGTVLPLSKISSSCRSDYLYVNSFFIVILATYLMKETSTIHSVDTELFYAALNLSFSKQYKYSVLILCARASQTFCSVTPF